MYLRDGSAQIILRAATLRQKLPIKLGSERARSEEENELIATQCFLSPNPLTFPNMAAGHASNARRTASFDLSLVCESAGTRTHKRERMYKDVFAHMRACAHTHSQTRRSTHA